MAEFPAMPVLIERWQADTRHLSRLARGLYMELCMEAWKLSTGDLPNDEKWIRHKLSLDDSEWQIVSEVLAEFWSLNKHGRLAQNGLTKRREYVATIRKKKQVAAKSRQRKEKPDSICNATKPNQTNIDTNVSIPPYKPPQNRFDEFWKAYPRKLGKQEARKAYDKALKVATSEALLSAIQAQTEAAYQHREKAHIPHASTWLNQQRWLDEVESEAPVNGSSYGQKAAAVSERLLGELDSTYGWSKDNVSELREQAGDYQQNADRAAPRLVHSASRHDGE